MSFSGDAKQEIAAAMPETPCCVVAACYGVACFAKSFGAKGLVLRTERAFVAQWVKTLFSAAGVEGKVYVRGEDGSNYEFAVDNPYEAEKLLALLGHNSDEPTLRIHADNFLCEGCLAAFSAAAFLISGIVVDPEKGYNLEFTTPRYRMLNDFAELLRQRGFQPGITGRKGANVLYFRSSEQIEDMLTMMGAPQSALQIMQMKVYRDHRNRANRITNCETANIDKTIAANRKTLEAIAVLQEGGVLGSMPEELQQTARLRAAHPEMSLSELAAQFPEPISKASLNRRFQKLRDRAAQLTAGENQKGPT